MSQLEQRPELLIVECEDCLQQLELTVQVQLSTEGGRLRVDVDRAGVELALRAHVAQHERAAR